MPQVLKAGEYIIPMAQVAFVRAVYKTEYQGVTDYWLRACLASETMRGDLSAHRGILSGSAKGSLASDPVFRTLGIVRGTAACEALETWIAAQIGADAPVIDIDAWMAAMGYGWYVPGLNGGTRMDD